MSFSWDSSATADQKPLAEFILRLVNDPLVERWHKELMGDLLRTEPNRHEYFGYAGGGYEWVATRLLAVHDHLRGIADEETITWSSTDGAGEWLRTPSEVFRERKACCADGAALFCALMLRLRLNPIFLAVGPSTASKPNHAIVAAWLEDRFLETPIARWKDVEPFLGRLMIMNSTSFLAGTAAASAKSAHAIGIGHLPTGHRDLVWRSDQNLQVPSIPDRQVLYAVDIRAYQQSTPSVITVIGTNGGVGKTTIAGCIAESIGATDQRPVVLVDFDIVSHALTSRHLDVRPSGGGSDPITVEDHLKDVARGVPRHGSGPVPVQRPRSSQVFCVPSDGRLPGDDALYLDAVRKFADPWVDHVLRVACQCNPVAVVVDCGNGHGPEVSALCLRSSVIVLVGRPDHDFVYRRDDVLRPHRQRLSSANGGEAAPLEVKLAHCVNMCGPEEGTSWPRWFQGAIPYDPKLENDTRSGKFRSYRDYRAIANSVSSMLKALPLHHLPLRPRATSAWGLDKIKRLQAFGGLR